jgi:GT2 family glycosyltransferase
VSDSAPTLPSVLAVVVVKNAAPWLRQTLASLARQTHPRLGVLAIDSGSTDGSAEILRDVLGPRRCIRMSEDHGFVGAVTRALRVPAAREADYLLLLHDDAALAPDAVERLLETAGRVRGTGIVAPKTLDWTRRGVLLDIGSAADRFGYPYSPLEEGEIDQGQYDAVREVLFVSSGGMLVSRGAWSRAGGPDERLRSGQWELDFSWRVRLSGLRVLVNPRAVAIHRRAGELGERAGTDARGSRYLAERGGLVALLKNYRLLTLLWILPLYAIQAVVRFLVYLFSRHADRAVEIARAWGWNIAHLPGTIRRRFRAQRGRRVRDREVVRFMAPAGARLQRWVLQASSLVAPRAGHVEEEEEPEAPPLRRRVASIAGAYPVALGLILAGIGTLIAFRDVLFVSRIEGGSLPVFPEGPFAFFREFASGWRTTGFGGSGGASPATVFLGAGSAVALGSPMLLARLLVALTPLLAGASCFSAVIRAGADRGPAVVAAACYSLSGLALWVASEGSFPALAALVAMPWLTARIAGAFGRGGPRRPLRWVVGTGVALAITGSFFPAIWVATAIAALPVVAMPSEGGSRVRGLLLVAGAAAVAAVLVFPFLLEVVPSGGGAGVGASGLPDFRGLLGLSPGPSPGAWAVALFLPLAGVLAYGFVERERRWAGRALVTAAAGVLLAWLAAAGYLPVPVSNPIAFLAPAAFSLSMLIGLGLGSLVPQMRRAAFGGRQLLAVALVAALAGGLTLQYLRALGGGWAVGQGRIPPAWPVVASADPGEPFRVLWLGAAGRGRFQPPGGDPQGTVDAGVRVSYGVTGRAGRSALAVGLPAEGPVYDHLESAMAGMLSGRIRHGGSLLAPFGIRFVVAGQGHLPAAAEARMDAQFDLDLVQAAGGMRIYRNAASLPEGAVLDGPAALTAARSTAVLAPTLLEPESAVPLRRHPGPSWTGRRPGSQASLLLVATAFDDRWVLDGGEGPFPAFGWALGFETDPGTEEIAVEFGGQVPRTVQVVALGVLWLVALWILASPRRRSRPDRRPGGRRVPVEAPATAGGRPAAVGGSAAGGGTE